MSHVPCWSVCAALANRGHVIVYGAALLGPFFLALIPGPGSIVFCP